MAGKKTCAMLLGAIVLGTILRLSRLSSSRRVADEEEATVVTLIEKVAV